MRTASKQDLSPDLIHPTDYAVWGVLENKTNAISHSNVGSFKTAIEEEWNKMFEEFILKTCKSFRRRVDKKKMVVIFCKIYCFVSIFLISFNFFELKLILLYNEWNPILASNNPKGVDMSLNK